MNLIQRGLHKAIKTYKQAKSNSLKRTAVFLRIGST